MLIGIDGLNLALSHGTGIARYARGLLRNIAGMGFQSGIVFGTDYVPSPDAMLNEIYFLQSLNRSPKPIRAPFWRRLITSRPHLNPVEIRFAGMIKSERTDIYDAHHVWNIRNLFRFAAFFFRKTGRFLEIDIPEIDIMHWTAPVPVRMKNARNIYTIHDMIPLIIPESTLDNKEYFYKLCLCISKNADKVCTVSSNSRQDIISITGMDHSRVFNTYLDSDPIESVVNFRKGMLGLQDKCYFLFFGAFEPKKNLGRLLAAYMLSGTDFPLVIAGSNGWGAEEDRKLLNAMMAGAYRNKIIHLEYVADGILQVLIKGARATLFPSLYEGFGLPILESMVLGTAVITSRVGSIPEVAGDAALLVDPYDVDDIARAICALASDDATRKALERRGAEQARRFGTEEYRKKLAELYS